MKKALLLFAPLLALMAIGATHNPLEPVVYHTVTYRSTSVAYASVGETGVIIELGPSQSIPPALDSGQTITHSWTHDGDTVTVTTVVGAGTNAHELALKRHDKLVRMTKQYYPPDP